MSLGFNHVIFSNAEKGDKKILHETVDIKKRHKKRKPYKARKRRNRTVKRKQQKKIKTE